MKKIFGAVVLLAVISACTREDDAQARRKLEHAKEELKVETHDATRKLKQGAHEAAQELKHDAHEASQEIKKGSEKLKDDLRSK